MSLFHFPASLALAAMLFSPLALNAVEDTTAPPIINTVCPMDGKPIDMATASTCPMTIGEGAEAKHYRIAMCSEHCCMEFKKDPAAVLKPKFGKDAPGPKTNFK